MNYKPGYIEGKLKKSFYLDIELAKILAYRAIDSGKSQSEIVEAALRKELGVDDVVMPKQVVFDVYNRADAESDWSVGYLDNRPAVGDLRGNWYFVNGDVAILNLFEGLVWYLRDSKWQSVPRKQWSGEVSDSKTWTEGGVDYVEGADEE